MHAHTQPIKKNICVSQLCVYWLLASIAHTYTRSLSRSLHTREWIQSMKRNSNDFLCVVCMCVCVRLTSWIKFMCNVYRDICMLNIELRFNQMLAFFCLAIVVVYDIFFPFPKRIFFSSFAHTIILIYSTQYSLTDFIFWQSLLFQFIWVRTIFSPVFLAKNVPSLWEISSNIFLFVD